MSKTEQRIRSAQDEAEVNAILDEMGNYIMADKNRQRLHRIAAERVKEIHKSIDEEFAKKLKADKPKKRKVTDAEKDKAKATRTRKPAAAK